MIAFALNHIVVPHLGLDAFLALAGRVGVGAVELRNDLPGVPLQDGTSAALLREALAASDLRVLSINALQRFNQWTPMRRDEAERLADEACAIGAEALVLCPVNEGGVWFEDEARLAALRGALSGLAPILAARGLVGLVEPLGFAESTLRLKREAVDAIDAVGQRDRFRLVHDTFHHFVAAEREFFPERTGLVHISGVEDPAVPRERMRDSHRVLVTDGDRLDNLGQIGTLRRGGYTGPVSFEPFAPSVGESPTVEADLRRSMTIVAASLGEALAA